MLVQRQVFSMPSLTTVGGRTIKDIRVGYETYGTLNAARDNALLICHYFAGTAHAAGKYQESDPLPGWWDSAIGPGKIFDTDRYFIVCSDTLCCLPVFNGSVVTTGPASINPETGKTYGSDFPIVRYADIVKVQKALLESLGIGKLVAVAGPSAGAIQALQWSVEYPDDVPRVIAVVSPDLAMGSYLIFAAEAGVRPILNDPLWQEGHYDPDKPPREGLAEAFRMLWVQAVSDYSVDTMLGGSGPADPAKPPGDSILNKFKSAVMLSMTGVPQAMTCDANHFLYLVRAGQLFDIQPQIAQAKAKYLFVPVSSDAMAMPFYSESAVAKLRAAGKRAELKMLHSPGGHADGLSKMDLVKDDIVAFLNSD